MFITLEGIEGVGKSSAMAVIDKFLSTQGIPHILTREPGGTPYAEKIRELLVTPYTEEAISYKTELLLFFAARAQHIDHLINPALARGDWVICDRFTDSSYAYQGGGRGIPMEDIAILEKWVQNTLRPDVTILLDAPVEICTARTQRRGALDRIETEQQAFFERIRQCHLSRAKQYRDRYVIIDASGNEQAVERQLHELLGHLCNKMKNT